MGGYASKLLVLAFTGLLLAVSSAAVAAPRGQSWHPIVGDDGQNVVNFRVPVELSAGIEALPGAVVVGNPHGDVMVAEFYDLNCPYCRIASTDLDDMVATDSELKLVLVPFPVLGVPSIQAGRVEIAIGKLGTPAQFYEFHRRIYAQRGTNTGDRALAIAEDMKFDRAKVVAMADADETTETMKAHVRLGNALGLAATPSFVVKGVAILGYPGRHALQTIVDSVRRCDSVFCAP